MKSQIAIFAPWVYFLNIEGLYLQKVASDPWTWGTESGCLMVSGLISDADIALLLPLMRSGGSQSNGQHRGSNMAPESAVPKALC